MVRVSVRQGSGFHTVAELSILSLRVGVANLFVIAGCFITDNRELSSKFSFFQRTPSAVVAGLNIMSSTGRPPRENPGAVADPSVHPVS